MVEVGVEVGVVVEVVVVVGVVVGVEVVVTPTSTSTTTMVVVGVGVGVVVGVEVSRRKFSVVEIFHTLQGEGALSGTAAVFVRFAGCNMWSGHAADRQRDAARNKASCPLWCDTDFRRGDPMTAKEIADSVVTVTAMVQGAHPNPTIPLVVLTGGEPGLQVDHDLVDTVKAATRGARIAIETNGTCSLPSNLDWITVSPKTDVDDVIVRKGDELKLVFPAYHPDDYDELAPGFKHLFVSPQALPLVNVVGDSAIYPKHVEAAVRFCLHNPDWRLSMQMHKVVGLP